MAIGDIPLVGALKSKMQWSQARQRVLAENVANADTPGFRAHDLKLQRFQPTGALRAPSAPAVAVTTTAAGHIQGRPIGNGRFATDGRAPFETTPNGNAVNLEEEMMKASDNQMDYQAVSSLYQRSLAMLKTAIGKGS